MESEQKYTPRYLRSRLWEAMDIIDDLSDHINEFEFPEEGSPDDVASPVAAALPAAQHITVRLREIIHRLKDAYLNNVYKAMMDRRDDRDDYEYKKEIVKHWNGFLRNDDLAIAHPATGKPCLLLAIGSRDGAGRYVLEDRETKKRSGAYKSLLDLLPVRLTDDIRRKEGFIEVRKRQEGGEG